MYLQYYNLREAPFNITPDPRFLFFSAKHQEAFNHLLFGIHERKGFIELTGEVGAGKTTICRKLLEELGPTYKTALILNPCLSSHQLIKTIAMEFGLNVRGLDRLAAGCRGDHLEIASPICKRSTTSCSLRSIRATMWSSSSTKRRT